MIYEKFFQNVPRLDEKSAPRFFYIGETMSASKLNDKIPQEKKLPNSIAGKFSHRQFWLRNSIDKTCLWKKYILLYE